MAECIARTVSIPEGLWSGADTPAPGDGIGLLVLGGLLIRRVGIDRGFGAELLGEGDLLRPWQGADEPPMLPQTTGWRVLQQTRMAVLDEPFARRLARYPQLTGRLVGRALQRSRNLAVNMAIVHQLMRPDATAHAPLAPRRPLGQGAQRRRRRANTTHPQRPLRPRCRPPPDRHKRTHRARATGAACTTRPGRLAALRKTTRRAAGARTPPHGPRPVTATLTAGR